MSTCGIDRPKSYFLQHITPVFDLRLETSRCLTRVLGYTNQMKLFIESTIRRTYFGLDLEEAEVLSYTGFYQRPMEYWIDVGTHATS